MCLFWSEFHNTTPIGRMKEQHADTDEAKRVLPELMFSFPGCRGGGGGGGRRRRGCPI